mmetsp:Transcript_32121/g.41182  ORF Transcript_32121/g.41182 Transcript_32121/m.41182 type:complete len:380 (+) Transcript_32121:170-1309(+)
MMGTSVSVLRRRNLLDNENREDTPEQMENPNGDAPKLFKGKDFLQLKYDKSELDRIMASANKKLVLGMGGGCDVFVAYTLACQLNRGVGEDVPETDDIEGPGEFLYANCISERRDGIPSDHLVLVENSLYAVPPGRRRPLVKNQNTYGTTLLEQSVPRGADSSPLLFELKGHKNVETEAAVEELVAENTRRLHAALDHLGVDLVICVDSGGDSLTGGVDWKCNVITGRDQQVISAMRRYKDEHKSFRFIHIVLGPGCDAETSPQRMVDEVWKTGLNEHLPWCSNREYLGTFCLEDMIPETFKMVRSLAPNRTPFIMYRALMNTEDYHLDPPQPGEEGYSSEQGDVVKIERHGNYQVIPRSWLYHGLAFQYGETMTAENL